jgi:hypothetical protein
MHQTIISTIRGAELSQMHQITMISTTCRQNYFTCNKQELHISKILWPE